MQEQTPTQPQVKDKLTSEELKRADRQRTIIGLDTMLKLNNSNVLITPLNGSNTELAKNLVLAGANISVYDEAIISEDDFQTNFLVGRSDIGKRRDEVILGRLQQMNPSAKNFLLKEDINSKLSSDHSFFKKFTFLCTSILDFRVVQRWYQMSLQLNIPYYNLVCCGQYAFGIISLGSQFKFMKKGPSPKTIMGQKPKEPTQIPLIPVSVKTIDWASLFEMPVGESKDLYRAILMLKHAYDNSLIYDPFLQTPHNKSVFDSIIAYAVNTWGLAKKDFYEKFLSQVGIDFCPVYSVLGSVISQQIIKVLSAHNQPGVNWFLYDSEQCYGVVQRTKSQKQLICEVVERTKMQIETIQ